MSFFRRYNGLPSMTPAQAPVFPLPPKEVFSFTPTQPVRSYAPGMFDPQTAASFDLPGTRTMQKMFGRFFGALDPASSFALQSIVGGMATGDIAAALTTLRISGNTSAEQLVNWLSNYSYISWPSDPADVATSTVKAIPVLLDQAKAVLAQQQARDLASRAAANTPLFDLAPTVAKAVTKAAVAEQKASKSASAAKQADTKANIATHAADQAAAAADADPLNKAFEAAQKKTAADNARRQADAAAKKAQDDLAAHVKAQADADAAEAQHIADKQQAEHDAAMKAIHDNAALNPIDDGGSYPDQYGPPGIYPPDQPLPEPAVDPVTGVPVAPPGVNLLAIAAAGGGGFLAGGPLGAVIGAAAGYFLSRPTRASSSVAGYRRRRW